MTFADESLNGLIFSKYSNLTDKLSSPRTPFNVSYTGNHPMNFLFYFILFGFFLKYRFFFFCFFKKYLKFEVVYQLEIDIFQMNLLAD